MKSNYEHSREGIRSEIRSKRRKTNMILNGLIGLVLLLIIFVSFSIFSNNDAEKQQQGQTSENKVSKNDDNNPRKSTTNDTKQTDESKKDSETKNNTDTEQEKDEPIVTEGGGDNVQKTIVDPSWESIGSTQPSPNSNATVDWDERVKALAYAINVDESNMTVWYLSRDGQDKAIGTVTAKDNPEQAYRIHLEWQDGGGWTPVKVEELIVNDKGQ